MKQVKDRCFLNHQLTIYDVSREQYEELENIIQKIFLEKIPQKARYEEQVEIAFNALSFAVSCILEEYNEYLLRILDKMGVLKG